MPATVFSARPAMPEPPWLRIVLCYIILLIAVLPGGCGNNEDFSRSGPVDTQADTLLGMTESLNPEIEILQGGQIRTRATAPRGVTSESQGENRTELFGPPVHVEVFDSLGRVETRIECDEAAYSPREFRFEFFGDVRVQTGMDADRKLRTERLVWNEETQQFTTDGFVIITTPADSITGYGFEGTQDLSSYSLRTVTGEFAVD